MASVLPFFSDGGLVRLSSAALARLLTSMCHVVLSAARNSQDSTWMFVLFSVALKLSLKLSLGLPTLLLISVWIQLIF